VHIHNFIVLNTIEDRVHELQKQKIALAKGILDGSVLYSHLLIPSAELKRIAKLTMADLKFLFDIDQPKDVEKIKAKPSGVNRMNSVYLSAVVDANVVPQKMYAASSSGSSSASTSPPLLDPVYAHGVKVPASTLSVRDQVGGF